MELPDTFVPGFHDENEVRKLKYHVLGKTGLRVSELSLGTGGFSYFYGDYDINECKKTVYEAIKRGINLIDTGPWYGHGVAEEILGKCLENIPRKAYYIATKVGRYEKDPKFMFDFSADKTKRSIDVTLKRLGLDYVDILQVHDVEFAPTLETVIMETLPTLEEIVMLGKAKFIGITGYPPSTLLQCIEKSSTNISTVLSYCRLTMIDDTLNSFIGKFRERNIGIINAAVNSMGLLSNAGSPEWHPAAEYTKNICSEARQYCKVNNVELGKLAVYYGLQQKGPHTTLVGMNSLKLLNYNMSVLLDGLSQKEMEVYQHVLSIFNSKLKGMDSHWENVELENYLKTKKGEYVEHISSFFNSK